MWNTFQIDDNFYLVRIADKEQVQINVTDLKVIWSQSLSRNDILQTFQKLNPMFDVNINTVVAEVVNLVNNIGTSEYITINDPDQRNECLQLDLKSVKTGYEVCFQFKLVKDAPELFLNEFTVPLLRNFKLLQDQQGILRNVIIKKDRELAEYKMEKGLISRDDLQTQEFDETALNVCNSDYCSSFWGVFQNKYGKITHSLEEVPTEPWNNMKRKRKVYPARASPVKQKKEIKEEALKEDK